MNPSFSKKPTFRRLRAYAFDPSLSLNIDTASINEIIYSVFWEDVKPGPIGEYIEVIDFDPTIKKFYAPVDLNDSFILSENGLPPSESNPQFHQQMVYAIAMTTIQNFERALGRKVLWATRLLADKEKYEEYVQHLRIYPHALRDANAYYSPHKKALLFGYFSATPASQALHMPNSIVFTCLSHDIIAHEVTHAILDGIHLNYNNPTNPDVLAFHEAFADIVALFQHFTFPEVLKHQIAETRGDLGSQNLLGKLAQELGAAIGGYGSLRDAIGEIDKKTKEWKPKEPNTDDYHTMMEPHERGSILVAAVFEAFINIYKRRVADLLRIATNGSGILPQGELHPDLVNRLAHEAAKSARHVLNMCIRALDYCPPIDITFGDYLRAIITADLDITVEDRRDYRLVFIDAFRRRGIYPEGIKTLSIESLEHKLLGIGYKFDETGDLTPSAPASNNDQEIDDQTTELLGIVCSFLRDYGDEMKYINNREKIHQSTNAYIQGSYESANKRRILGLHQRLNFKFIDSKAFSLITGLAFIGNPEKYGIKTSIRYNGPSFQIQNLRLVSRVGHNGNQTNQVIFSIIQKSGVIVENGVFKEYYVPRDGEEIPEGGFELHGGCTLIFDLDSLTLKYTISKPLLDTAKLKKGEVSINKDRIEAQYRYQFEQGPLHLSEHSLYFGMGIHNTMLTEPFAFLHKH